MTSSCTDEETGDLPGSGGAGEPIAGASGAGGSLATFGGSGGNGGDRGGGDAGAAGAILTGGIGGGGAAGGAGGAAGAPVAGGHEAIGGSSDGGIPGAHPCDATEVQGGAGGEPLEVDNLTRCECDGPWARCYSEPEHYCLGPEDLGCDPTLEAARRSVGLRCVGVLYYECGSREAGMDFAYGRLAGIALNFNMEAGRLYRGEAYPVDSTCNPAIHTTHATYSTFREELEPTGPAQACRYCYFGPLTTEYDRCIIVDGRLSLPPAPIGEGGSGGGAGEGGNAGSAGLGGAL